MDGLLETIKHSLSCEDAVRKPAEETLLTMAPRKGQSPRHRATPRRRASAAVCGWLKRPRTA